MSTFMIVGKIVSLKSTWRVTSMLPRGVFDGAHMLRDLFQRGSDIS